MKTNLFLILLTFTALPLAAQEQSAVKAKTLPVLKLEKNATLGSLAELLRRDAGLNVILASGLSEFTLPDLMLSNISAEGVLHIVDSMIPEIEIVTVGTRPETQVITIQPTQYAQEPLVTRIFKVGGALSIDKFHDMGMRISQVMNKALKSDGTEAEEQPQIDCHPPTGIFIVKGRESQVRIVSDIIAALGGEAVQAESDSRTPQQSPTKADDQSKVTLQYIGAEEAVRAVIDALGGKSASAVLRIEPQTNTVEINTASEAAMRVKVLLEQLDQRPQSHQIESIIKKGAAQDQQIVARPTVLTMGSQPAVISLGEGKDRVEIELTVKPGPLGDGWIAKTARDLEHARENLQKLKKQSQQTVKQVQSALLDHEAVSINATKPMPPVMPANCRTSCVECHAQAPVFAPKR